MKEEDWDIQDGLEGADYPRDPLRPSTHSHCGGGLGCSPLLGRVCGGGCSNTRGGRGH